MKYELLMKKIAELFSYLMHPLLLPLYGLFFIFNSNSVFSFIPAKSKNYCYLITFICLCILPVLTLPLFRKLKLIQDYHLSTKQERIYPVLISIFYAFLGFYLIRNMPYTNIVQQMYLVLIIVLAGFAIITLRWKMSMHMTAIGAVCGFLLIIGFRYFGDVRSTFMWLFILSGFLGTCRLYLKKHNPAQIYTGFLFGLSFVYAILF